MQSETSNTGCIPHNPKIPGAGGAARPYGHGQGETCWRSRAPAGQSGGVIEVPTLAPARPTSPPEGRLGHQGHIRGGVTDAVRAAEQRRADTLARLEAGADVWVATADAGRPHLVPLSLAWDGTYVILATPAASPTARNAAASGEVRLALGTSRDVTIIEAAVSVMPCTDAPEPVAVCYATRTGWDPRQEDVLHAYLIAIPRAVRAWNSLAE